MSANLFEPLISQISAVKVVQPIGRVTASSAGRIIVSGLTNTARLNDRVSILSSESGTTYGEIVEICDGKVVVMPDGDISGLSLGTRVTCNGPLQIAPCDSWLGRILDGSGNALDGSPLPRGDSLLPLRRLPKPAAMRRGFGERLKTGSFALNTLLPLVSGQRIGLFAGSGVGKSSLLATLVKNVDCDVVVTALIGERGRELRHFTDETLGPVDMAKSVVVAATSDQSALERRRCAWTAMTIAEYFRDQGKSVLFLADSITRFAEAHREVASVAGEVPVLRGHPPSTAQLITELCERSGPGVAGTGDITAVFSVLVQGSDMEEPIADILRGVLDGHIVLNREIAERGRYPAIDLLQSVSRSLPAAATEDENSVISKTRKLVSVYEQNALMIRSGLYVEGSDSDLDMSVKLWPEIDQFLGRSGPDDAKMSFDKLRLLLRRAGAF